MTIRLAVLNGTAIEPQPQKHADAALIALKERLRSACEKLSLAPSIAGRGYINEIARAIAVTPARTLEGVLIKGTAVRWTHFGPDEYFEPLDFDTAIGRLFVSLLHDLDKFGAAVG